MTFRKTSIGYVPDYWDVIKLIDAVDLVNGKAFKESEWSDSGLPIVRIQNLKDKSARFNYYQGPIEEQYLIENEELLFSWSGSIGTSFGPHIWWGERAILNQHIFKVLIKSRNDIDKAFLYYYFIKITKNIEDLTYGLAALVHIRKKDLESISLTLPPLPEQRAISRVLRTVQQAREARLREIALERERKAALMEHLFRHGTRGEATKETEIGEMPESWGIVKLGEVVTATQYGLSLRGNSEGSYPILRMNCLVDGYVNASNLQYVDLKDGDFHRFRLNKGDLLFNRTNSCDLVGKTGLFNLNGDFVFASYLIRIAVHTSRLLPEFVNYYINMNTIQIRLRMLASRGVSQSNINATKLKDFLIPLPSCPEQKIVADILRACDAKIAALEHEAHLHDELFRAMLEELMTGRLRAGALAETAQLEAIAIQP